MAISASRVDEGAPARRPRKRPNAGFPTVTLDLGRTMAGIDNALAWMSRVWGLRRLSTSFARWGRRIVVHLHTLRAQKFAPPGDAPYEMLQLWMSNGAGEDVEAVRCLARWTSDSALLTVQTNQGLWLRISPYEETQRLGEVVGEVDLPAVSGAHREGMQYLGLAIKYPDDEHAYVVTGDSYRSFVQENRTWRCPSTALAPGRHFVDIAFRAAGGGAALVRLEVLNLGRGGPLKAAVLSGQLLA